MKAVVLVHGWGMNPGVFGELRERLSVRFNVQAPALPGYGGSSPCEPYTPERLAAALAAAAPEHCFVAGWSMGGQVALAWARAMPQQVEGVVLLGATPCFVQREGWSAAIEPSVLREFAAALDRDHASALERFIALQAQGDQGAKSVLRYLRLCLERGALPSPEILHKGLDLLLKTDLRSALPDVVQDALVVHGERDALSPLAAGEYLAHALPHGRLAVIRGAAHAPFVSDPDQVSRSMLEFFDER